MRKEVVREVVLCDAPGCEKEVYEGAACPACRKSYCYEHHKTLSVAYHPGLHSRGGGTAYYCLPCDSELRRTGTDPLHAAYLAVVAFEQEYNAWHASFDERHKRAEAHLERLLEERPFWEREP